MSTNTQRGMTMIELLIGIVIVAILLAMGSSSFFAWIQNSQIRTAAESLQNGLQVARAEAVRRNATVRFQLTTSADGTCGLSATGTSWVVTKGDAAAVGDPSGLCDAGPSDTVAPFIIQKRNGEEGSKNAVVTAGQSLFVFNALGRTTNLAAGTVNIDVTNATGGACAPGGNMRCLRVTVAPGGQVRMCDPAVTVATDSRAC